MNRLYIIQKKILNKIFSNLIKKFEKLLFFLRKERDFLNFKTEMVFYDGFVDKKAVIDQFKVQINLNAQIFEQADKLLAHRFNLLGSGELSLGQKIEWHHDFKSGYRWPKVFYQKLVEAGFDQYNQLKADIKVPWELSRLQDLITLGQAYYLSSDEKYTEEFIAKINHWIDENPPEVGVNWVSSMDISLRVISLIFAYFFFRSSPAFTNYFRNRYFSLLYYSGVHIEQNLEVSSSGLRNNHHLTNCAAMVWLGIFFKGYNKRANRWLDRGINDLCLEMDYQVNPDGGSFEGSISYHRLALEIFMFTTILAEKNIVCFPSSYKKRFEKMCEFTMHYIKPNGLAPQFGDADNGRFCILNGYGVDDMRDHRTILGIAGEYFQRNDFKAAAGEKIWDALWIFAKCQKQMDATLSYSKLIGYSDTGLYIMRNDRIFFVIKCGSIGQKGNGGHDHNDQLSFEVNIDGMDIIIDPGSYIYTMDKDARHAFRSTKFHNVSCLGDLEQNIIKNDTVADLFKMYSLNKGVRLIFNEEPPGYMNFLGEIVLGENQRIQYKRSVQLNEADRRIIIKDYFMGSQEKSTCRLHLSDQVKARQSGDKVAIIDSGKSKVEIRADEDIRIENCIISPSYGVKINSLSICWDFCEKTEFHISY
ncbi:alginate lyase family protein [Dehalobacter sp. TBBPA1]|uniref:alginate lyase family protein n=1 Tax=Dehalobacter sp. TBBPA1 TaxID=3235037 RepID=UPI0034A1BD09